MKQLVVNAVIRPTSVGTETLSFFFMLGPLKVVCVANIPGDGEESAPAYIKLQLPDENGEYPTKSPKQRTAGRSSFREPRANVDNGDGHDVRIDRLDGDEVSDDD